jgi:hypothetical protein
MRAKLLITVGEFFLPRQREFFIDAAVEATASIDYSKLSESALKEILAATTINDNGDAE